MAQVVSQGVAPDRATAAQVVGRLLGQHQAARAQPDTADPNHMPMTLIALNRLGAPAETLGAYAELHSLDHALLPPPVSPGRVAREDWRTALGDPAMEQAYRAYFETELVRLGRDAMLREYLPDLMEGCGASGFHPMIRLAFGIQQDDDSEIVLALAYWATTFLKMGHAQHERAGLDDPRAVLERLRRELGPAVGHRETDLETGMTAVGAMPGFEPVLHWLNPEERSLAQMAEATLALFFATGGSDALHVMAATHALRTLLPWFYDPSPALRFHWQAVAAAYLAVGAPPLPTAEDLRDCGAEPAPPWQALRQAAIASLDDHLIQAVYTCSEEETAYGDPVYRIATARFMAQAG